MNREPVVSGRFYPDDVQELRQTIRACFSSPLGVREGGVRRSGRLRGLVLPHAGYIFSGPIVSWGMARLLQEDPLPRRFLILGPKHTPLGAKAAVSAVRAWRTPFGLVPVDEPLREALGDSGVFTTDNAAHSQEHSIEVMLPFLQEVSEGKPFTCLPLALGFSHFDTIRSWGESLAVILRDSQFDDVCVIVSSDFSHETPRSEAYRLDGEALDVLEAGDPERFYHLVVDQDRSICGVIPITTWLCACAGRRMKISRLAYSTSMDVMEHPRGVGYAAVAFEEIMGNPSGSPE